MNMKSLVIGLAFSCVLTLILSSGHGEAEETRCVGPNPVLLATDLEGASGSTIGPSGALYVTERATGEISRVDPQSGKITTFATGLPPADPEGFGGAVDVVFFGSTAYALVTLVGGDDVVGIYRVDGPDRFTIVADIGEFSMNNPPPDDIEIAAETGVQYALETYRGEFLVTDGHHNRVLRVTLDGEVTELIQFGNIVPTGLAVSGNTVYVAQAGPVPHRPEDGKVVSFEPKSPTATEVASGARLLVDVEFGHEHRLYALSQGEFDEEDPEGSPAQPGTGALVADNEDGTFSVVTNCLDRPSSLEFIGDTAYIVTLDGEIWQIDGVSSPHFGVSR